MEDIISIRSGEESNLANHLCSKSVAPSAFRIKGFLNEMTEI
jgi:hypothetical protein